MQPILVAMRWGIFREGRFLGRVLDEWAQDTEQFVRLKVPHLITIALIAFVLSRILGLLTSHMISVAERHSVSPARIGQVKTLAGVIRTTGLATIGVIVGLQFLDALGVNLAPLLASAGIAGVAIGLAAQNIVRDVLNGVTIIMENQFNVGDTVRLA
ncbi:MAG: mechanosensitive ion channel domain-containing protein, partial [Terracidiphilus sp.]